MGLIIKFRCSCDEDECDCKINHQQQNRQETKEEQYKDLIKLSREIDKKYFNNGNK